jgi:hypothetical protein
MPITNIIESVPVTDTAITPVTSIVNTSDSPSRLPVTDAYYCSTAPSHVVMAATANAVVESSVIRIVHKFQVIFSHETLSSRTTAHVVKFPHYNKKPRISIHLCSVLNIVAAKIYNICVSGIIRCFFAKKGIIRCSFLENHPFGCYTPFANKKFLSPAH